MEPRRPADPLNHQLNSLLPLLDTVVQIALEEFLGAFALMAFFDEAFFAGTFFVVSDDFDITEMFPLIPERFGGLMVGATNNSFLYSFAGHEQSSGEVGQV